MISCSLSGGHVKMTNKRLGCPKIKEVDIITCVGNCLSWEDVTFRCLEACCGEGHLLCCGILGDDGCKLDLSNFQ